MEVADSAGLTVSRYLEYDIMREKHIHLYLQRTC